MLNSVFCEITEPSNFIGDCQQVENTFEVTVAQEYDFNTEYIIQTSGISQAPKESQPTFEINTFSAEGGAIGSITNTPYTTIEGGTISCNLFDQRVSQYSTPGVENYLFFQV